ncbi:Lipase 3 [Melipona quadrifasciata]|uniref:Lipase 3 n=1 Tax=Melipona quadrifasciata TaxID=166423 RepID=A0A0N0BFB9_9HYME|nr:Lipase 3 [Melipona quadrifasciata]
MLGLNVLGHVALNEEEQLPTTVCSKIKRLCDKLVQQAVYGCEIVLVVKDESSATMLKKIILRCVLPVIVGVSFIGQHEANEIFQALFDDETVTAAKIAQQAGYSVESYDVVTQDGYILRMERITGSKKSPPSDDKTAVLLVHGLLDASPTWLVAGPEKALGFMLADKGYDVWLGNVRGNRYSRKNLFLSTSDPDFWNFIWNEMGMYDMPAMIDRIIQETKQEKMFVVTHSQGGSVFFGESSCLERESLCLRRCAF